MVVTGRKKGADLMIKFLKNRIISKLWVIPAVVLGLTVFLTVTYGDAVKINKHSPRKKYEIRYGINGRAVSLKVLQKRLSAFHERNSYPKEILRFGGIKTISGYIVDKANQDLIIFGKHESNLPSLYLDDFVIALRNAWLKYASLKGNTYYYSEPGCSIDPDPEMHEALQNIKRQIHEAGKLVELGSEIRNARPTQDTLFWDYSFEKV